MIGRGSGGEANAKLTAIAQNLVLEDVTAKAISSSAAAAAVAREKCIGKQSIDIDDENRTTDDANGDLDLLNLREKRMAELRARQLVWAAAPDGGSLVKMTEQDFIRIVLKVDRIVCLFYMESFVKCQQMSIKLQQLAPSHPETLFVLLEAEKCPFLTTKMAIRVLPTTLLFLKGTLADSIIGFEGLVRGKTKEANSGTASEDDLKMTILIRRLAELRIIRGADLDEEDDERD